MSRCLFGRLVLGVRIRVGVEFLKELGFRMSFSIKFSSRVAF